VAIDPVHFFPLGSEKGKEEEVKTRNAQVRRKEGKEGRREGGRKPSTTHFATLGSEKATRKNSRRGMRG